MRLRRPLMVSFMLILAMVAISAYGWVRLPAEAELPIHWGIDGRPDAFASKPIALLGGPGLALLLTVLFAVLPAIEPRRLHLERSARAYQSAWIGVLAILLLGHAAAIAAGLGIAVDVARVIAVGVGALFVTLGNWLPKTSSNFVLGVRTPWTLSSERSWSVTHRLAGRGFVLLGLGVLGLGAFDAPAALIFGVMLVGMSALATVLVAVSYRVWRSDRDRAPFGGQKGAS